MQRKRFKGKEWSEIKSVCMHAELALRVAGLGLVSSFFVARLSIIGSKKACIGERRLKTKYL
jgi:hypothetical protein